MRCMQLYSQQLNVVRRRSCALLRKTLPPHRIVRLQLMLSSCGACDLSHLPRKVSFQLTYILVLWREGWRD